MTVPGQAPPGGTGLSQQPPGQVRPGQSWLAVIDMQRVFGEPGSAWFAPRFDEIIGPIHDLVAAFHPRVIFTRFIAPTAPVGAWERYYQAWPFALQPPDARIYELVDEFAADAGPTLDAVTFSKWGPQLMAQLGEGGRLVLAGVSTDCCVLSTAVAAADAGVAVHVVSDACAGVTDDSHHKALDILGLYAPLIEVICLADLLSGAEEPR